MGLITIEIPQKISRKFRIEVSDEVANEILFQLEKLIREKTIAAPGDDTDGILGLWADRAESAEEIALELRAKSNNRHLKDG